MNRSGPKTDPYGTPVFMILVSDVLFSYSTYCFLFDE